MAEIGEMRETHREDPGRREMQTQREEKPSRSHFRHDGVKPLEEWAPRAPERCERRGPSRTGHL